MPQDVPTFPEFGILPLVALRDIAGGASARDIAKNVGMEVIDRGLQLPALPAVGLILCTKFSS